MEKSLAAYRRRYNEAKDSQLVWRETYDEAYEYTMPNKNSYQIDYAPGLKRGIQVFDPTPIKGVTVGVSKFHANTTPYGQQWTQLVPGYQFRQENSLADVENYFNELQDNTNDIFQAIQASNLENRIYESFFDYYIGTGALIINQGPNAENPIVAEAIQPFHYFLEEGPFGDIKTVFRDVEISVQAARQQWPDAKFSSNLNDLLQMNPTTKIQLVEAVIYDYEENVYYETLWSTGDGENELMRHVETDSSPFIIFRWSVMRNELFGRGPVLNAMPTIKSLNESFYNILISESMASNPPRFGINDGIFNPNNARLTPGAIIPRNGALPMGPPLEIIEIGPGLSEARMGIEDYRNLINRLLYAEPIFSPDDKVRTATEQTLRMQQIDEEMGPVYARLRHEALIPIIKRVRFLLGKFGLIKKYDIDHKNIDLQFSSPLTQGALLQKANGVLQMAESLGQVVGPQLAMQVFQWPQLTQLFKEAYRVPYDVVKDANTIQEIIDRLTEQLQQQEAPPEQIPLAPQAQQELLAAQGI